MGGSNRLAARAVRLLNRFTANGLIGCVLLLCQHRCPARCRWKLQWQTYDIAFHAPHYDPSDRTKLVEPARVTVIQNGMIVQNAQVITGLTHIVTPPKNPQTVDPNAPPKPVAPGEDLSTPGPIRLQFHGNTVAFRNIWIVPLPDAGAKH